MGKIHNAEIEPCTDPSAGSHRDGDGFLMITPSPSMRLGWSKQKPGMETAILSICVR